MPLKDGSYKGAHMETRRALLEMLKLKGELSSADMAEALGVSSMAVRQHLQDLEDAEEVSSSSKALGVGRPTRLWKITPKSDHHFPDRHRDLMLDLLDNMKRTLGDQGMKALLKERKTQQVEMYRKNLAAFKDSQSRVKALAQARSEEGYMAEIEEGEDGSLLLIENHCPICAAASSCTGLCEVELDVFRESLGKDLQVERQEHMLSGSRRCVYRIAPAQS